jgi:uncharacterized damage-inducible protein DinB
MTPETAKTIADFLAPQLAQEHATTRKVLAAVPADNFTYKPSEKCMTAIDLATHIAAAEAFFLNGVINGGFEWKQPDLKTPAEVLKFYDEVVPPLLEQVNQLPPEKLAQVISFAIFSNPAVAYLQLHLKHNAHHRGQLSAYLRPMGGKVPSIYGPSADEGAPKSASN